MISISSRAAVPLTIAIAVMAVPISYHGWVEPNATHCANPDAILHERVLPNVDTQTLVLDKYAGLVGEIQGTLALPGKWKSRPQFRVARTLDVDHYYFLPRKPFTHAFEQDKVENLVVEAGGTPLPLHLRVDESYGTPVTSLYFYIVAGKPVRSPFFGSITVAVPQLLFGSSPLTMVLVSADSEFEDASINRSTLIDWTQRAWAEYQKVCEPEHNLASRFD